MSARALARALVALLAAALLAGCVDRGRTLDETRPVSPDPASNQQPYEVVQGSFDKLSAAGTAKVRSESETQVTSQTFQVTGTGNADFRARTYDLNLDVPVVGSARVVGIVNVLYLQAGRLSAVLPGNPQWLLLDPARLAGTANQFQDNPFVRFAQSTGDALPQLALVKGARQDETRVVGPDTVEGQPATHYTTELDIEQAKRFTVDPQLSADLDRYTQTVKDKTLPAEVWTDAQGRLVRLKLTFSTVFGQSGTGATLSFSDLGAPIPPIAAPPRDQVTDAATVVPG